MRFLGHGRFDDPSQLRLEFDRPAPTAEAFLERLRRYGLKHIERCRLTRNRAVMVSFTKHELRVHRGYLDAPPEVLRAIVVFVSARTHAERRGAQAVILAFPVHDVARPPVRRPERPRPEDPAIIRELTEWHREYNARYFAGTLSDIRLRISGRMRTRLGQYMASSAYGEPPEITISRSHVRRHGWAEALHTLLHEMVHQWQAENGLAIDHGALFRAKAREVGIVPNARRELRGGVRQGRVSLPIDLPQRAARQE
ncbi:MAG: SprT-like domain-containing protein [Gemmatimonadota bacterium]|nr:SprT-like domain-containing protein [Gemmatimonadota bacterium]